MDQSVPGNHTVLANSTLILTCKVLLIDDTCPPQISWLRHYKNASPHDKSEYGNNGLDKSRNAQGFRLIDEYNNPLFDVLQTCALNGICPGRETLEKPLEYSLKNIQVSDAGYYSCRATNCFGTRISTGYIDVVDQMPATLGRIAKAQPPTLYIIGASTLIVFLILVLAIFVWAMRMRKKKRLRTDELNRAQNITPYTKRVTVDTSLRSRANSNEPHPIQWPSVKIERRAAQLVTNVHKPQDICRINNGAWSFGEYEFDLDQKWELNRSRLDIGDVLGEGEFGRVASAVLDRKTTVAVKMLKEGHTDKDVIDMVKEMSVMKQMIHDQPNIIKLIGVCTQPTGYPLLVVVEFAEFGNLKEYLLSKKPLPRPPRNIHPHVVESKNNCSYEVPIPTNVSHPNKTQTEKFVDIKELLNMSWQVSKGMTYLSQRKFVHRDLAARNILVYTKNVYKIADFGMARPVRHKDYYRRTSSEKVPLKWMAPESILDCVHTTKSDVWSYGILLWEIFSYGDNPYKGLDVDVLIDFLKLRIPLNKNAKEYMMEQPFSMNNVVYQLMIQCWDFDPNLRPNWFEIEGRTRSLFEVAQPREYLVMTNIGTPCWKTESDRRNTRGRVGSSSSRLTVSSSNTISTNRSASSTTLRSNRVNTAEYPNDELAYMKHVEYNPTAPLIERCSTG